MKVAAETRGFTHFPHHARFVRLAWLSAILVSQDFSSAFSHFLTLADDWLSLSRHQLATGGVVGSSQVVNILTVAVRFSDKAQTFIFSSAYHLALMRDGLDVIFILMGTLVQCMLWREKKNRLGTQYLPKTNQNQTRPLVTTVPSHPGAFSELGLLRVVEPLYSDHHVAGPGFPKTLNETNEGEMRPTSREENCTVATWTVSLPLTIAL